MEVMRAFDDGGCMEYNQQYRKEIWCFRDWSIVGIGIGDSCLPLAGKLLGVTCIWLSVATALITDTWRLNPITTSGKDGQKTRRVPLFPVVGEAETTFLWFNN